jgi:hypothetical protein
VADDVVFVDPVFHIRAYDVVALLFEQKGGDGAVDSAREGNEDAFAGHEYDPCSKATNEPEGTQLLERTGEGSRT